MGEWILTTLKAAFPGAEVSVTDTTGGGDHFEVQIAAAQFAGKAPLAQHRMVYAALGEQVGYEIHALALKTRVLQA